MIKSKKQQSLRSTRKTTSTVVSQRVMLEGAQEAGKEVMKNKPKFFREIRHLADMIASNSDLIELIRKNQGSKFQKKKDDFFLREKMALKDSVKIKPSVDRIREICDNQTTPARKAGINESAPSRKFHKFNKLFGAVDSAEPSVEFNSTKEVRGRLISLNELDGSFENAKITNFASARFVNLRKTSKTGQDVYVSPVKKRLRFSPKKQSRATKVTPRQNGFRFDLRFHCSGRRIERASERVVPRSGNLKKFSFPPSPQKVFSPTHSIEKNSPRVRRKEFVPRVDLKEQRSRRESETPGMKVYVVKKNDGYSYSTSAMSF